MDIDKEIRGIKRRLESIERLLAGNASLVDEANKRAGEVVDAIKRSADWTISKIKEAEKRLDLPPGATDDDAPLPPFVTVPIPGVGEVKDAPDAGDATNPPEEA